MVLSMVFQLFFVGFSDVFTSCSMVFKMLFVVCCWVFNDFQWLKVPFRLTSLLAGTPFSTVCSGKEAGV